MNIKVEDNNAAPLTVQDRNGIGLGVGDVVDIGTKSYNGLTDKPSIGGVELIGNKTLDDLDAYTQEEVNALLSDKADASDIPTKTSQLQNDSGFITSAPVTSVNNKTGAVTLTASDVNALPSSTTIPTKVSQLQNDSGYITDAGVTSFNGNTGAVTYTAPVTKVNNKTGDVTLTASDVSALPSTTSIPSKTSDLVNDSNFTTKTYVDEQDAEIRGRLYFGQVDNTSTATKFTATIDGITEYFDGLAIMLKNGVVTSASGFTININGLGAKQSYSNMAAATADTTLFNVNYTMLFVYDSTRVEGGGWICYRGYDANTNTIGYQIRTNSYSLPMDSVTYRYRLLFTSDDNEHFVPANNSTSTNATASRAVCQSKINPLGPIVYYGTTASVAAGSRPSAANLWQEYTLTLGYSFNRTGAALTLTEWKPVYVKCAPQADGSAIIDDTTPYVQDLPTAYDGKLYIFLGVAYSETAIELNLVHPVYWHDGTSIRLWTGTKPVIGETTTVTPTEVHNAILCGETAVVAYTDAMFGTLKFTSFSEAVSMDSVIANTIAYDANTNSFILGYLVGNTTDDTWVFNKAILSATPL